MNRETLIAELNRLLDLGEPLLTAFPKGHPGGWILQLPDNISNDMDWYGYNVALRAWDREQYQDFRRQDTTAFLVGLVEDCESGLLGWRAIGVLKGRWSG